MRDLGRRQAVAHFGKFCDIGLGSVWIAERAAAQRASEINRHDMGKFVRTDLKFRRAFPIAAFHHIARRCKG